MTVRNKMLKAAIIIAEPKLVLDGSFSRSGGYRVNFEALGKIHISTILVIQRRDDSKQSKSIGK